MGLWMLKIHNHSTGHQKHLFWGEVYDLLFFHNSHINKWMGFLPGLLVFFWKCGLKCTTFQPQKPMKNEGFKPLNIWVIPPKKWRFWGPLVAMNLWTPSWSCLQIGWNSSTYIGEKSDPVTRVISAIWFGATRGTQNLHFLGNITHILRGLKPSFVHGLLGSKGSHFTPCINDTAPGPISFRSAFFSAHRPILCRLFFVGWKTRSREIQCKGKSLMLHAP